MGLLLAQIAGLAPKKSVLTIFASEYRNPQRLSSSRRGNAKMNSSDFRDPL
ncbi:hypothetical protein HMP0721_2339 [Pseudoramibacter alactolyticus ATCC 23263]|uniref:Uncharacterized protein n=1 Tax=Pseudoramibacter alactolyticus ATCC 23263 TaxID=887929 RepID=E6MK04_9FIRM|nr:hypothetical protein HMP0721_2339 [Pseudoramibacter alactolyticus ATCC 23263]